jgi:hypothetical protein
MDSELFTIGGRTDATLHETWTANEKKTATTDQVNYQWVKTLQTFRHVGKVLYWFMIVYVIYAAVVMWPQMVIIWNSAKKSGFTQKEGLQYLGASTNVTRDDTGWPTTDSLAEAAMRAQNQATAELSTKPSPKVTFVVPREHMAGPKHVMTPEEELLKKQKAAHM